MRLAVFSDPQPGTWRNLFDAVKKSLGRRRGQEGEIVIEGFFVNCTLLIRIFKQGFDLGGECDPSVVDAVVKRLDSDAVPDQPELTDLIIP